MNFSSRELLELGKAWIAVSLAFAILFTIRDFALDRFLLLFGTCLVVVGAAFLLHELAHKFFAQRYGCWAEFRADNKMLLLMLAVSFFGFIFAAPGGVLIHGALTRERHGKIAFAGPFVNLLFAVLFLALLGIGVTSPVVSFGFHINSWLAFFNLLPLWQFDGLPVLRWNKIVYGLALASALVLSFFGSFTTWRPF